MRRNLAVVAAAALALSSGAFGASARMPLDSSVILAADDGATNQSAEDKALCDHTTSTYRGMLVTGEHSWKGKPLARMLEDVKSCEKTGHVAR